MQEGDKVNTDFPKSTFTLLNEQIKQADTKAAGTLSILAVTSGILINHLDKMRSTIDIYSVKWIAIFVLSLTMVLLAFKGIISVLYPRGSKGNKSGLMYYNDILTMSREEYITKGTSLTSKEIAQQSYGTSYSLAQVIKSKYNSLKIAMIFTVIVVLWTILVIILS